MNEQPKWVSVVAGAGYSAKTVMYCMLGLFILSSAISAFGSENTTQQNVFQTVKSQPFGQVMLTVLIIGLICYTIWRWLQAALNTEDLDMSNGKDIIMRVFLFVSGVLYAGVAYLGLKVLTGEQSGKGGGSSEDMTAQLMQYQWGQLLVGAIGVTILIFAFIQFKHAYTGDFMKKFKHRELSSEEQKTTRTAGRLGYTARGVVYVLVGGFFAIAAWRHNPEKAGGLQQALSTLTEQAFGQLLLGAVGAGFVLFGIYCAFEARYRRT
ncbi:DUF1206 domain-containing protein [Alteromonas sp. ASW11-19]|uniref:DUF1206 domain-containing protein n=1 Tax=Alteromonas salexigens TaxID=2982530 RepID=A0ABT2VL77_9ALTE|nr:DUF1206 domain-containing protein [Alteromonas salexigens]MCU7553583.1 DUF1206 domain-containing protein [Alteromonas salexigens]